MARRVLLLSVLFLVALPVAVVGAPAPTGQGQGLKYQFKPGETYVYVVTIVAERNDATETLKGHIQLAVKSAEDNQIRITPAVNLPKQVKMKAGVRPPFGGPPRIGPPTFIVRELVIDSFGQIIRSSGDTSLPYLLGNATELVIEPLSPKGAKSWERSTDLNIREIKQMFPFARFGPQSESDSRARETVGYEIADGRGALVRVTKKYELKSTAEADPGTPRILLQGTGEILFDSALGAPKSCEFKGSLNLAEKNVTVRVPITMSHRLLDGAEAAAFKKEQEEIRTKAIEAVKAAVAPKAISEDEIGKVLADLKSDKPFRVRGATQRLFRAIPIDSRRDEVTASLEALLKDRDAGIRAEAAKALKTWASAKNVPALVGLLTDTNIFARHAALEALGKIPDPKSAEAVAQQLPELGVRMQAVAALKAMGPVAEKAVLPYLKDRDWAIRRDACKILADIGTTESLPALKSAAADSNRIVSREAEKSIKSIEGRKR